MYMDSEWISPTAKSDDHVRVAQLTEFDDKVALFSVNDTCLNSTEEFRWSLVAEAFNSAEKVPDEYTMKTIFRVTSPEKGDFKISSYDKFVGRRQDKEQTVGLQFDAELASNCNELIQKELLS